MRDEVTHEIFALADEIANAESKHQGEGWRQLTWNWKSNPNIAKFLFDCPQGALRGMAAWVLLSHWPDDDLDRDKPVTVMREGDTICLHFEVKKPVEAER